MTVTTSPDSWFVVRTQSARERYAAENIARQGVPFYLPEVIEVVRKLIRGKRTREFKRRCLFPGYIFARPESGQWHFLTQTYGVVGLVTGAEGEPGTVQDTEIQRLRAREDADGVIRLPAPNKFANGQRVRPGRSHGQLSEYVGLVDGYTAVDCVRVLFECMGRKVPILVGEDELIAA